jgi:hypothetical protein
MYQQSSLCQEQHQKKKRETKQLCVSAAAGLFYSFTGLFLDHFRRLRIPVPALYVRLIVNALHVEISYSVLVDN